MLVRLLNSMVEAFATQEEIDEHRKVKDTEIITPEEPEDTAGQANDQYPAPGAIGPIGPISPIAPIPSHRRKFYLDGGPARFLG